MSQPLLTIAIPTYNRATLLELCLDRIISQLDTTDITVELLVSNNASTDNTRQVVERYQQRFKQLNYFENEKNGGPDFNIAKCFELASGKYVWVFSDDDIILPGALNLIVPLLAQNDLGVIFLESKFYRYSVHEFVASNEPLDYKIYSKPIDAVIDMHFWITYISGVITNKNLLKNDKTLYQYQNSNLIQLGWVLPALFKGQPNIKIKNNLILGRALETLDFKLFQVYGISYPHVLNDLAKQGVISQEVRDKLIELIIKKYFHYYINPQVVYTYGERPFAILSKSYWQEPSYWTTLLPLFVRRSAIKTTRKITWPIRQATKKMLAAGFGKVASIYKSVQADTMISNLKGFGSNSSLPEQYNITNPQCVDIGRGFYALNSLTIEARSNYQGASFSPLIVIGHNVKFGAACRLDCIKGIHIGDWVVIGHRVLITDNELDESPTTLLTLPPANRQLLTKGSVKILDNVLIEDDVRILSGVTIGENTIIRAGAVVRESVPANAIVTGNPAQVIEQFGPARQVYA